MKNVPSNVVKQQSRELTSIFEAFIPYNGMEGRVERIWITDRNRWNSLDEMEISK
jgi:threonylcarbamoyladenosine tRNA methylthiotransferase CDKAL1